MFFLSLQINAALSGLPAFLYTFVDFHICWQTALDWVREFCVLVLQSASQTSAHTGTVSFHSYRRLWEKHTDDLLTSLTNKCLQMADKQEVLNGVIITSSSQMLLPVICRICHMVYVLLRSSRDQHSRENDYLLLYGVCNIIWLPDDACSVNESVKGCPLAGEFENVFDQRCKISLFYITKTCEKNVISTDEH